MKNILCLVCTISLATTTLKADLGSCIVYHAKFYLKNGTAFNGCFEVAGYDEFLPEQYAKTRAKTLDSLAFAKFKQLQKNSYHSYRGFNQRQHQMGKAPVYKSLEYVSPRALRSRATDYLPLYGFVRQEDVFFLDSSEVSKIVFWSAESSKRWWITSEIIPGSSGMLDTISNKRYWNKVGFLGYQEMGDTLTFLPAAEIDGPYSGYAAYNYNANINDAELKRLIALKFPINWSAARKAFDKKYPFKPGQEFTRTRSWQLSKMEAEKFETIRRWFWAKGILLVAINGTC